MIEKYLINNIKILDNVNSWEESIISAADILLKKSVIKESYIKAMINNVNKNGSYIVVMPQIALAHARSETGVIQTGLSLLKLNQPVLFPEKKSVKIVVVLAAEQEDSHLQLMSELAELFINEEKINKILSADSINIIQNQFEFS